MSTPKIRTRYLPTLTQVVDESALIETPNEVEPLPPARQMEAQESDFQRCVDALMPVVQAQLREMVREVLDSQIHHLEADLRLRIESLVRSTMQGPQRPPAP